MVKERSIIFDAGPIISLTTNNLLWILEPLKKAFGGSFFITPSVKRELVDVPLLNKRYKFEALQVLRFIEQGILQVLDYKTFAQEGQKLSSLANKSFSARGRNLRLFQTAEMDVIAAAIMYEAESVVIDERTTRMMIEQPRDLKKVVEHRLHTKVKLDRGNSNDFRKKTKKVKLLRSTELVMMAYELGLLDEYVGKIPEARKELLQSVLWGLKIRGCSVTQEEIDEAVRFELKGR